MSVVFLSDGWFIRSPAVCPWQSERPIHHGRIGLQLSLYNGRSWLHHTRPLQRSQHPQTQPLPAVVHWLCQRAPKLLHGQSLHEDEATVSLSPCTGGLPTVSHCSSEIKDWDPASRTVLLQDTHLSVSAFVSAVDIWWVEEDSNTRSGCVDPAGSCIFRLSYSLKPQWNPDSLKMKKHWTPPRNTSDFPPWW